MNEDFWLIFGGRMYQGTKVCRAKESCRYDLRPWPCDLETEIPFCSVSPKRMKIFGWYLMWGCIRGQRCVTKDLCRCDLWPWPSDLDAKLHNNSLPLCIFETNEDFWLIFGGRMYRGDKGVSREKFVSMWPLTLKPKFPSAFYPKRIKIFYWYLVGRCIRGQRCVAWKIRIDVTFDLDPVTLKPKLLSTPYLS
jgi:hypothetical protein